MCCCCKCTAREDWTRAETLPWHEDVVALQIRLFYFCANSNVSEVALEERVFSDCE